MGANNTRSASMRRARSRHAKRGTLNKIVRGMQLCILLGMSAFCGIAIALFISLAPTVGNIQNIEPAEATIIYSSDGTELGRIYHEDRTNVPLKDIPVDLRNATIAIEDKRFYTHSGVDLRGIGRAMWQNLRHMRPDEGASTITQQLAKNVYLTQEKTVQRKVQEAIIAILMERKFSKDKILELYLNQVFYGSSAFGVQAASRVYFDKDVKDLDLAQCATLAGLPKAPTAYSPHRDPDAALGRRNVVLDKMCEQGYITAEQRDDAKGQKLHVVPRALGRNTFKAPHFVDYVTNQLRDRYEERVIYSGLRVYTTLNYDMQVAAEKALREGVKRHERSRRVTEGCFVAIEPENGYIRAMVGSVSPTSQFNRCTQAMRQPGSSFKAFVYTAALMQGWTPETRVCNERRSYPDGSGGAWTPRNYDGNYGGWYSMRTAIAKSMNLPAIWTANKIGVGNVIDYATAMGIKSKLDPYLPTAIGGIGGLHPIEMASAYCTFANDGIHVEPCCIVRVLDHNNKPIQDFVPEGRRVIPERINSLMDSMLRGVVTSGTGRPARVIADARGKTGTTNNDVDAWFIGYVPHKLVAACWVGNDNYDQMRGAYGSVVCAPVWVEFMKKAIPIYDRVHAAHVGEAKPAIVKNPSKPANSSGNTDHNSTNGPDAVAANDQDQVSVTICTESHQLATPNCPSTRVQRFLRGTQPRSYCSIHSGTKPDVSATNDNGSDGDMVTVSICVDSGMLAGPNCPNVVKKEIPASKVPTQVCTLHSRSRE